MNFSYWELKSLITDSEFVIAGAGITGLCAALELRRLNPEARILVLERGKLPSGGSTKNAGFACFGSLSEMLDDAKSLGETGVLNLVEMRWKGLLNLRNLLGDKALAYQDCGNYELFRDEDHIIENECLSNINHWNSLLSDIVGNQTFKLLTPQQKKEAGISPSFKSAIFNQFEGKLHSGAMMQALLDKCREEKINVWFGFEIKGFEELGTALEIQLEEGTIRCNQLLIATNAFAKQLLPDLAIKPARNQVILTSVIPQNPWKSAYHIDRGYFYFREIDGRILIGGGRHLAGEAEYTSELGNTPEVKTHLINLLDNYILTDIPYQIDMEWSGILGLGPDRSVILKRISNRVSCGVRMGGMGVAIGSVIGQRLAGL